MSTEPAIFDAYVALRVTTNADSAGTVRSPEIIELAAALVCPDHRTLTAEFHAVVRPTTASQVHPGTLTKAGIAQQQVDDAKPFGVVLSDFAAWIDALGFGDRPPKKSYCVVSVGGTDLARAFKHQAQAEAAATPATPAPGWALPEALTRWASLFPLYVRLRNKKVKRLDEMRSRLTEGLAAADRAPIDAAFAPSMGAARRRSQCAVETVLGAQCLALMIAHGARPDFTVAPDVSAGFKHWRVADAEAPCACVSPPEVQRTRVTWLPTAASESGGSEAGGVSAGDASCADDDGAEADADTNAASRKSGRSHGTLLQCSLAKLPRDPIQDILLVESVRASMQPEEFRALIRKMNVFLRVDALKCGVDMTIDGYVLLDAMLAHPRFRQVKRAPVAVICLENEKNRFSLVYGRDGQMYIRANHAHNFPEVDVNLTPIAIGDPVRYAVHGTNLKHWPSIRRDGLNRMARRSVIMKRHPAAEEDGGSPRRLDPGELSAAAEYGLRRNSTCFVCVDVQALLRDGVPCSVNANRAVVCPGIDGVIPPRYFAAAVDIDGTDLLGDQAAPQE
eukprot:CAMPEP_0174843752 /NCGR_PEP_ID=MMETSP1114-20130205/10721_1 /TAXON_ID=312471 /ORGANISM="Neobodo designis, Strain CCAP 1951/1" /LENGTH=562 /DNA_ID=CAMNT_0016077983 /DNA_START=98 /DNA_END=1786 /DNA_ORIENTATION=+